MAINKDLSALTNISITSIDKILDRYQDVICYQLQENLLNNPDEITLDIFIGKLILYINKNEVTYKFIPSSKFEKDIISTINNNECPLIGRLEKTLTEKITTAYKEFF